MRKIAIAVTAVAALSTIAVTSAEARGGRNAALGFGIAAGALTAGALASSAYGNRAYSDPYDSYAYDDGPVYGYYGRAYPNGRGFTGGGQLPDGNGHAGW